MISAIMPTTGRPHKAASCVKQFFDTTREHEAELIAMIDRGDTATLHTLLVIAQHEPLTVRMIYEPSGPVKLWNEGAKIAAGDFLVLAADDLWWMPGWLDAALACHKKLGSGLVGFNDLGRSDDLGTHFIADRQALRDIFGGVLAVPHYFSQYLDVEATNKAKQYERYAYCKDAHVEHRHRAFNKALRDETYMIGDSHSQADRDTHIAREAAGYPIDYEGVL